MKSSVWILRILALAAILAQPAVEVLALYPEPPNVFFGRIRGPGGAPLDDSVLPVRLQAFVGPLTNVAGRPARRMVAETVINFASGIPELPDFAIQLRLDGGGIQLYHPMAVMEGESVELVAIYGGVTNPVVGTVPLVGPRGTFAEMQLAIPCPDSDRDGLCNDCEEFFFFSVAHPTRGQDDFDGDGYSNAEECALGTDPTDASSVPGGLVIGVPRILPQSPGGEMRIGFGDDWDPRQVRLEWSESVVGPFLPVPADQFDVATRSVRVGPGDRFFRLVRLP